VAVPDHFYLSFQNSLFLFSFLLQGIILFLLPQGHNHSFIDSMEVLWYPVGLFSVVGGDANPAFGCYLGKYDMASRWDF